jgi:hypothetical protein
VTNITDEGKRRDLIMSLAEVDHEGMEANNMATVANGISAALQEIYAFQVG